MASRNSVRQARDIGCDMNATPTDADLLYGVKPIAAFLGIRERQARHLIDAKKLPTFSFPGSSIICARRSTLNAWLAEREAAALKSGCLEH